MGIAVDTCPSVSSVWSNFYLVRSL
jgi:hypothetical protein